MPLSDESMFGLQMRFKLVLEAGLKGLGDLGSWTKIEGLDVTWDVCEYRAGDAGNFRWYVPGITKYSDLKLTRAVTLDDTPKVKKFLDNTSFKYKDYRGSTGSLAILGPDHQEVMKWKLEQVMIKKWSITGFNASTSGIATETLDVVHLGFLEDDVS
jgi:phage tail-like protein